MIDQGERHEVFCVFMVFIIALDRVLFSVENLVPALASIEFFVHGHLFSSWIPISLADLSFVSLSYNGCISFACPEHSERILSNETRQNSVLRAPRLQVVQSGQNMADRVKHDLDIEHDRYLTLIVAQVHLVQ
jgi:hypothetical protein